MRRTFLLITFGILLISSALPFNLNKGWVVHTLDGRVRTTIDVPSTVKQALCKSQLIPNPYFSNRNEESQWVEKETWVYEKDFSFRKKQGKRYFLKLNGITPRGEVYLNERLLGKVEGMFAQPLWEITDFLINGENKLKIIITPERERTRAIACQMSYGWDFAPRIIPIGVWRPVEIIESRGILLKHPFLKLLKIEKGKAVLNLLIDYDSNIEGKAWISLKMAGLNFKGRILELRREVEVKKGEGSLSLQFILPGVKLWYPAGYGPQNLYKIYLSAYYKESLSHSLSFIWGARELEWEKNPNTNELYGWIVKVNGVRVYCKGANWVPVDSLFDLSPDRYERLIKLARLAGINMFRIWGGGIIEEDTLYELCDRYGIMLWQEFPLACADYPNLPREAFLENARDAIFRLRNHPSLALWCGGNEFDPDNQSNKSLVDGLDKLCRSLDGTRPFHRASPYGGDVHDWSVWHGSAPYTNYRQFTVFRSEAGLQAPPPVEDIFKFLSKGKIFPPSDEWSYHLADAGKIAMYAKQYGNLSDLENFVKKAQLAQSLTYQFNLDSCLKNIWRNSGCLIWQFNDPWPNISWSMVDWYGNPKPSLYWFKKASSPLNIAVDYDKPILRAGDQLNINLYGVNLTKKKEVCEAIFLIASPRRILQRFVKKAILQPQSAEKLWSIDFQLTKNYKGGALFLLARLVKAEKLIADKVYPIPVVRAGEALKPPVKVLAILSSIGQEAEGWREIASLLLPFGIEFDISTPDSLPDLAKYACFVIGESEGIGGRLKRIDMERIGELVRSGKGLLLDGGWNAYAEGGLKGTIIEEISPFVFKEGSLRQDLNLRIIKGEGEHPILQGLSFSSIAISGYNEEKVKNGAKILLSLSNGSPLLAEVEWGKGRCLAYTSGLRGGWAGGIKAWDRYPFFLARLFLYLAHRENEIGNLREEAGGLDDMPSANLRIERRRKGKIEIMRVKNCSAQIAFFLSIKAEGLKVQPIFSDNYFTLLPGEEREVVYEIPRMGGKVLVEDWKGREWK